METNFNYGNYRELKEKEQQRQRRLNSANFGKIIRTHTIDQHELNEHNRRLDKLLTTKRELNNFSPLNEQIIGNNKSYVSLRDTQRSVIEITPRVDNFKDASLQVLENVENFPNRNDYVKSCLNINNDEEVKQSKSRKLRHHKSLNEKKTGDLIVRNLSSDEDDDEDDEEEFISLDPPPLNHNYDGIDEDEDDGDEDNDKKTTKIYPNHTDPLKLRKSFLDISTDTIDSTEIYDLLNTESNTIRFSMQQPTGNHTVKCFIWRNRRVFNEYTMYVELENSITKKFETIPILIARKKKIATKLFIRIDALSIRKSMLEIYKRFQVGKLKSKNVFSFKSFEFLLTNTTKQKHEFIENKNNLSPNSIKKKLQKLQKLQITTLKRSPSRNATSDLVQDFKDDSNEKKMDMHKKRSLKEFIKITYETNLFKQSKPCNINVTLLKEVELSDIISTDTNHRKNHKHNNEDEIKYPIKLINKQPQYDKERKKFILDFKKRVQLASVNNFQLIYDDLDNVIMQCGKTQPNYYICDYKYPLNAFQAFSIALSKLCGKIA